MVYYTPMEQPGIEQRTISRITWRLIPFMMLCYLVAFIDRTNLGAAKLQMTQFDNQVYGFAAGIFFFGYFLFEVPSNLIMEKVGARIWIARIMIIWGFICAATMFVGANKYAFYGMRFLLGVGEAGFFPGMILYLTYWFPTRYRARTVALFMSAAALSGVVGNLLSGFIMKHMDDVLQLKGWQWLFILEGIPASILGVVVFFYLPNGPRTARWLAPDELAWLEGQLAGERAEREKHDHLTLRQALMNPKVLLLSALYFMIVIGGYGPEFFMPAIIKDRTGWTDPLHITALATVPSLVAAVVMVLFGRHSDRTGERRWHVFAALAMGAVGLAVAAVTKNPVVTILGMCLAVSGRWSATSTFWGLPTAFLSGTAAAGGIAMINSIGNLGGHFGPASMGWLRETTKSYTTGLLVLAACFLAGAFLAVAVRVRKVSDPTPTPPSAAPSGSSSSD